MYICLFLVMVVVFVVGVAVVWGYCYSKGRGLQQSSLKFKSPLLCLIFKMAPTSNPAHNC